MSFGAEGTVEGPYGPAQNMSMHPSFQGYHHHQDASSLHNVSIPLDTMFLMVLICIATGPMHPLAVCYAAHTEKKYV